MKQLTFGISKKIILSFIVLITTLELFLVLYFVSYEKKALLQEMEERSKILLNSMETSCEYPLLIKDRKALAKIGEWVLTQKDMAYCEISDKTGALFEGGAKAAPNSREYALPVMVEKQGGSQEDLLLGGGGKAGEEEIGRIRLLVSLEGLAARLNSIKKIAALAALVILGAASVLISFWIEFLLGRPIARLAVGMRKVAAGALDCRVDIRTGDEIGALALAFNAMTGDLKVILSSIRDAANRITASSGQILAASRQQAETAKEQSAAVAETSAAASQGAASAEDIGKSIRLVSDAASRTLDGMARIKDSLAKTSALVAALGEKSRQIADITALIDDVADRTNLLAINASIEAALAGEQGRGFTVVASEIRKLSDSTARSTKDIAGLVEAIRREIAGSIAGMDKSVSSVDEDAHLAEETSAHAKEIAMGAAQQVSGARQIAEAMNGIDAAMKQVDSGSQQSQAAAKQLAQLAQELQALTGKFKLA